RALAPGPVTMDIMTGRHEITGLLQERLVAEPEVFGGFRTGEGGPALRVATLHHLAKVVNGALLRRPPWYFDVAVQGTGVVDVTSHMVDHAQRLLAAGGAPAALELTAARDWATPVPLDLFRRVTGAEAFPAGVAGEVAGGVLGLRCNGELSLRAGAVEVELSARWEAEEPPGGGDAHRVLLRGARADVRVDHGPATGWVRRLRVEPRPGETGVGAALAGAVERWARDLPGLALAPDGVELVIPPALRLGHEAQFARVLAEFLDAVEGGGLPPARRAGLEARYTLLARAAGLARGRRTTPPQEEPPSWA
ncbi:MAG TPA: putative oxidoreductase C-terminal domain-containing protein, partial [Vicinamibacteria bacterium]|nr:putative oxidoreductase C-terminal domain-containing protein [Vicinamibacteria bacterium]